MNKRNLYDELSSALSEAKMHDTGKLKLKSYSVEQLPELTLGTWKQIIYH